MSLIDLAECKKLPQFQHIDKETLAWININKPKLQNLSYRTNLFNYPFRSQQPLQTPWFLEPQIIDGIHGTRHAIRVGIYANALAKSLNLNHKTCQIVAIAALLHDVRRKNDNEDPAHGMRCAEWIENDFLKIDCLKTKEAKLLSSIMTAIRLHEVDYKLMSDDTTYQEHSIIVDILKTADALDRYRLPKLKWWIDNKFLKLKPTDEFKAFAFDLVTTSEERFLQGDKNELSVIQALKNLNL